MIAGAVALTDVMEALSQARPAFHSEADFQFSFAQTVTALAPHVQCRLERPIVNPETGRIEYLDLLCLGGDGETPIEFKYFTRRWHGAVDGETFQLRGHAALDLLRLHFVHDMVRLEQSGSVSTGLAVLLTNDSGLWKPSPRKTRDREFHLHDGRELSGTLLWADGTYPANTRHLRGTYALNWEDYSRVDEQPGGELRYLACEVEPAPSAGLPG